MAAWTEAERVKVRHYLGFSAIFLQADPRLENALTSVLAVTDGGTRPDNSTQLHIQALLLDLDSIEAQLRGLRSKLIAIQVDEIKVDAARAMQVLCKDGRRLVTALSAALATRPRRDIFAGTGSNPYGDTFEELYLGHAGKYT